LTVRAQVVLKLKADTSTETNANAHKDGDFARRVAI